MELISLEGKTNFFESKNSSYNKANASGGIRKENEEDIKKSNSLSFDADF